jgi:hypothetical protein
MFDKQTKIQLLNYLESVTLGATESKYVETLTEPQIDRLIRLCKVDPTDEESMARAKRAMDKRDEYRATMREEKRKESYVAWCAEMDRLNSADKQDFDDFVRKNDITLSMEVWNSENGLALHEIMSRLLFGDGDIDKALAANYTCFDKTIIGSIIAEMLVDELDYETKRMLFWKYANAIISPCIYNE